MSRASAKRCASGSSSVYHRSVVRPGQIAIMRQELVERPAAGSERRFPARPELLHAAVGPEGAAARDYIGWLMHRTWGGVLRVACLCCLRVDHDGTGVGLPYFQPDQLHAGGALGHQPAVVALVLFAVYRIANKSLNHAVWWGPGRPYVCSVSLFRHRFPVGGRHCSNGGLVTRQMRPQWIGGSHGDNRQRPARAVIDGDTRRRRRLGSPFSTPLALIAVFVALGATGVQHPATGTYWPEFFTIRHSSPSVAPTPMLPYVTQAAVEKYRGLRPHR